MVVDGRSTSFRPHTKLLHAFDGPNARRQIGAQKDRNRRPRRISIAQGPPVSETVFGVRFDLFFAMSAVCRTDGRGARDVACLDAGAFLVPDRRPAALRTIPDSESQRKSQLPFGSLPRRLKPRSGRRAISGEARYKM